MTARHRRNRSDGYRSPRWPRPRIRLVCWGQPAERSSGLRRTESPQSHARRIAPGSRRHTEAKRGRLLAVESQDSCRIASRKRNPIGDQTHVDQCRTPPVQRAEADQCCTKTNPQTDAHANP